MTVAILSFAYVATLSMTGNEMMAGSVTVSMGVFSAIMYLSPILKGAALTAPLIPDFTEKSSEECLKMSREDFESYLSAKKRHESATLKSEIQAEIALLMKENGDSAKIKTLENKMNALIEEHDHALLEVKSLTEKMSTEKPVGILGALKAKSSELKEMISKGAGKVAIEIEMKAAQNPSDITNREELGQWLDGVGQLPKKRTYIKDRIRVVPTNKEDVKYVDQTAVIRDAKNVAQCGASTHNTKITWETFDLKTRKVRDFVDVCIDMMDDYDFVTGEIRQLVDDSVALKVDNGLLLDNGTAPNLNSIDSYSSAFNAANPAANYAASVQAATIIDLIVVAAAQIMAFGEENFFMADTVYLNPKDYTLMKLLKDGEDNYIKAGTVDPRIFQDRAGRLWIDGTVLVLPNPNVVQNTMYIFDSTKATIYQRKNAVVEFAYENKDNFEKEVVTVKAYERVNMLVRNSAANAFMKVSDITAAVTAITKP
jgi:hypothetical protein